MHRFVRQLLASIIATAVMHPALAADTWPSKPIHLIVAYPAGGGLDFVTRAVGQRLSEGLGQQVIVENRSGASGSIGADVAGAAPSAVSRSANAFSLATESGAKVE